MNLNAEFDRPATVHAGSIPWKASPMPGVERRMLDRIGDEVARATSIVRYAPGSAFSEHTHTGGEEFLVLEGVFQDEHGDFPVGTYVRNPPTSHHTPRSDNGTTIFVKLWQFDPADRQQITIDTYAQTPIAAGPGVSEIPLYQDSREIVRIEIWEADAEITKENPKGLEILVIEGGFTFRDENYQVQSWLRLPPGQEFKAMASKNGARLWIKSNHLKEPQLAPGERS